MEEVRQRMHHAKLLVPRRKSLVIAELAQLVRLPHLVLPWKLRVRIARDAASALCYLHEKQLLHRDIKPDNVLIDNEWRPVLSDYGFARKRETSAAMTICGTEEYMAPEMIWGEDYDERVVSVICHHKSNTCLQLRESSFAVTGRFLVWHAVGGNDHSSAAW
jgi:serine/threonine protein kinase